MPESPYCCIYSQNHLLPLQSILNDLSSISTTTLPSAAVYVDVVLHVIQKLAVNVLFAVHKHAVNLVHVVHKHAKVHVLHAVQHFHIVCVAQHIYV